MHEKLPNLTFFLAIPVAVLILVVVHITNLALAQPDTLSGINDNTRVNSEIDGVWATRASMLTPRDGLGVAAAPNGKIYAIGGRGSGSGLPTLEEYNPATDKWATRASMPTARGYLGVATAPNGKIYAIGGSNGVNLATVEEYDPTTNSWTTRADMPTARMGLGIAVAPNGKIYAMGGCNGQGLDTVEEYDPVSNTWATRASMSTARCYLGVVTAPNGKIYAIGGSRGSTFHNTVEEYDPINNTWATRASMSTIRDSLGITVGSNGLIYAVGGRDSSFINLSIVEEYNPSTNTWATSTAMPTARNGLGVTLAANAKLYAIGGWNGTSLATVEEYTLPNYYFLISGRVTNGNNGPIGWVTLNLSNNLYAMTNSNGYYTFTNVITGTYTITPTFDQYGFTPDMRVVSVPPDAVWQDFMAISPTPTITPIPTSTPTKTPTLTPTQTPLSGYLSIVLKPRPPTSTPTSTPLPPSAPYLNPIDNSDQDNYYTVSWGVVYDAESYILEQAIEPSFNIATVVYQGNNINWVVPTPGKTPSIYYYRVKAINIWGISAWSNVQQVIIYPLFVGLNLRWDGMGYIRGSQYYDVGYHVTRNLDQLTLGYIVRSDNSAWYDPNPQNWPPSHWVSYYAVTSGEFLSSSAISDPSWKWVESWILPYNIQFYNGQTVDIDGQAFLVSGPLSGYTAFGLPVQYWEIVNKSQFLYWDGGGDWKQFVYPGDIVLRYDAGNTKLEIYSSILRHTYNQGNPTSDTVQYIINLMAANSFPSSQVLFMPSSKPTLPSISDDWPKIDISKLPGPQN